MIRAVGAVAVVVVVVVAVVVVVVQSKHDHKNMPEGHEPAENRKSHFCAKTSRVAEFSECSYVAVEGKTNKFLRSRLTDKNTTLNPEKGA